MTSLKFGPNGLEYIGTITNETTDDSDDTTTGLTINNKRFKITINSSFEDTSFIKKINNNKINNNDIIVYTCLSNTSNLNIKIYNVSNGECYIQFIADGNVPINTEVMFLILT